VGVPRPHLFAWELEECALRAAGAASSVTLAATCSGETPPETGTYSNLAASCSEAAG